MKITPRWMTAGLLLAGSLPTRAHVVLEEPTTPAGGTSTRGLTVPAVLPDVQAAGAAAHTH